MKTIVPLVGVMILIGIVGVNKDRIGEILANTAEVQKEVLEVEVHPEWATDEDALRAAQDVIQRKEWEAELNTVQGDIEALRARESELEKNLGTY